jgi:uncharacterized membrane protein
MPMPSSKWLIAVLVISLGANLVLAGFLIGRTTSNVAPTRMGPDPAAIYFRMLGYLPEQRREELMPIVRRHLDEVRPEIRATRVQLQRMNRALTAEPFDAAALEAEMAELRRLHARTQAESHRSFVQLVAEMTPEERAGLAEAFRRGPPGRRGEGTLNGPRGGERFQPQQAEQTPPAEADGEHAHAPQH